MNNQSTMEYSICNKALQINQYHVIESDNLAMIKNWFTDICKQYHEFKVNNIRNDEQVKVNLFRKTLGMKYNTYRLIDLLNSKKRGIEPYFSKEYLFWIKAKEILDEKTFQELMIIAEYGRSLNPMTKTANAVNNQQQFDDLYSRPRNILYYAPLEITTEHVMECTDIERLTTWYAHLEFEIYNLNVRYMKTKNEKLNKVICNIKQFKQVLLERLQELKLQLLKNADLPELQMDELHMKYITRNFQQAAKRDLPISIYMEILEATIESMKQR